MQAYTSTPKQHHLLFRQTRQKTNAENRFLPEITCNADKYCYNHLEGIKESALGISITRPMRVVNSGAKLSWSISSRISRIARACANLATWRYV